jgi:hypothetical protein
MAGRAEEIAAQAAQGFGVLQCRECARKIQGELSSAGLGGQLIEIRGAARRDFMICLSYDGGQTTITQNGRHVGVRAGELVFDNLHLGGLLFEDWLSDFDAIGGIEIVIVTDF